MKRLAVCVTVVLAFGCGGTDGSNSSGDGMSWEEAQEKWSLDSRSWSCDTECPDEGGYDVERVACVRTRGKVCGEWSSCRRDFCQVIRVAHRGGKYEYAKDCVESIEPPQHLDGMAEKCVDEVEAASTDIRSSEDCEAVKQSDTCQKAESYL